MARQFGRLLSSFSALPARMEAVPRVPAQTTEF